MERAQVAFKSDYLRIFQAQQLSAAELLVAKEALAEARQVCVSAFNIVLARVRVCVSICALPPAVVFMLVCLCVGAFPCLACT